MAQLKTENVVFISFTAVEKMNYKSFLIVYNSFIELCL